MNVLIADDQPLNRKLLTMQLESEGHTVIEASNGAEALSLLDSRPVDLIISDILMPVIDGYRFCAEVRGSGRHGHLPFIFYTATYTSSADEQLCGELGGDAYLRKPLEAEQLFAAIERVLAAPRRQATVRADVLRDYSERLIFKLEQKNEELAAASGQLRLQAAALDSAADAILITDGNGRISWVNRSFRDVTGCTPASAAGATPASFAIGLPDAVFTASFWETAAEPVWRDEVLVRLPSGPTRCYELTATPDRDEAISHVVGVLRNVTERRETEEQLRESDRRFRDMLANLDLIALMLDRHGRITYCNDHLLRLTGWQREEIMGRHSIELFIPPESRAELTQKFSQLILDLPESWHYENEIVTRTGRRLLIQWNNSVLRSPAGAIIGTASIGQDVTERRNLERQSVRAQRLESLGTLAGGIAHDMNNLLMPILMGATLLKRLDPREQSLKAIENIERSVKRGSDLVKQVLLFARGDETLRRTVRVGEVVSEVLSIATSSFPRNIAIDSVVPHDLGSVVGDATQLSQVLLNLCVNARDAMPAGGHLLLSASNADITNHFARLNGGEHGGEYVVLEVTDTGEGMSKEVIDRIFDPFFTTKEPSKGTGLGLSTVQGIVSSYGGFISVSSRLREGTTFAVYLPRGSAEEQAPAALPDVEPPRGNGELVMVVDDDETVLRMTGQTLETFGYMVLPAGDGAEAIGLFSRRHAEIALVVTDMAMPVIDGYALIAALRRINPGVPIIAATGNIGTTQMGQLAKTGIATILAKPFTADQLLHGVAAMLRPGGGT